MKLKKVFACGVSWGDGKPSYFEDFKKHNAAILGSYNKRINKFRNLKKGDLIASKKGHKIFAIAEVVSAVEEYWFWKDFIDEAKAAHYGVSLEDEIDIIKVNKWIELKKPIIYKNRRTAVINKRDIQEKCNEAYYKEIKKMEKEEIIDILKQKKQIILQGAPGTGKTYSTAEIAVNLIDENISDDRKKVMERYKELIKKNQIFFTTFHQSMDYEEFVEGYKPVSNDENISYEIKDGIFKEACNRAKEVGKVGLEEAWNNFTYDFSNGDVEGINKDTDCLELKTLRDNKTFYLSINDDNIVKYLPKNNKTKRWLQLNNRVKEFYYSLKEEKSIGSMSYVKPLLEYLKKEYNLGDIEKVNKNPVVLIIDEINRGNIAKIFGELITLLEADKRKNADNEIEVKLPYSKEIFSVPSNLYIIGTMNTTDRSIGYIDYALRRRFAFITIKADKEKIESFYNDKNYDCKNKALKLFDDIENNIINNNLNEEFEIDDIMIGHSYFMAENEEELKRKLEYEIKPLLLEYYKDGILKSNNDIKDSIKKLAI
ncbi:McrB family protein [Brachyspira pilosicoli]|uniref:McrB family protein n=1 Tax=Brachyspira pilosicoli TaxID=52584 RepID=UPI001CA49C2D|nr:AAA family ATPase [Brachyspira pilosicoli]MBW5397200.1 AAA family ATPase [Brachyspira pilosicoli]